MAAHPEARAVGPSIWRINGCRSCEAAAAAEACCVVKRRRPSRTSRGGRCPCTVAYGGLGPPARAQALCRVPQLRPERAASRAGRRMGKTDTASSRVSRSRRETPPACWRARSRRWDGASWCRPPAEGPVAGAACACCGLMAAARGLGEAAPARHLQLLVPAPARGLARAGWLGRGDHRQQAPGAVGRRGAMSFSRVFCACVRASVALGHGVGHEQFRPCGSF